MNKKYEYKGNIYCEDDLSENGIEIETNMEVVIENDLLLAINQQCKELGWI